MALGRMLALTLQSPVLPLPYNPKFDVAFTASIERAIIKSGATLAIPRTVILRQKMHSEIVSIIETDAIKIGATDSFLSKMANGLRILFGRNRIIGVLHRLCQYPCNFCPDIFFGHML